MTKMSEIAQATGFSLSTISEILRGKPGYNEKTREKVLATARQLNYTPNPISQALTGGRSMSIGLFVASSAMTYTAAARVEAILSEAGRHGYRVYLIHAVAPSHQYQAECEAFARDMITRRADGIIFDGQVPPAIHALMEKKRQRVVYIDNFLQQPHSIEIDRTSGIGEAARHLYELGHRKAATFLLRPLTGTKAREHLYHSEMTAAGLEVEHFPGPQIERSGDFSPVIYEKMRELIRSRRLPGALFINNDDWACIAMAAFRDAGIEVGREISLIGFDDLPMARYLNPPLTTITMPGTEVGHAAFHRLASLLDAPRKGEAPPVTLPLLSFPTRLAIRQTTAPPIR